MKSILKVLFITIIIFVLTDFFFGKKIDEILVENNFYITFDSAIEKNIKHEKKFRVKNEIFSHSLKENYKGISFFGNKKDFFCTNIYGFKDDCEDINNTNYFEYLFIGDSFTEGVGLKFNETFVGIFKDNSNSSVANLGVQSYSPIIYYYKLKFFLEKGLKTKNIIVYLDVGDFFDEHKRYSCNDSVCYKKIANEERNEKKKFEFKKYLKRNFLFTLTFLQYSKKLICTNIIIEQCSYVYDKNYLQSSWINNFESTVNSNLMNKNSFDQLIFYLDEIYKLSKENNISFTLAVYPWPGNILHDKNISEYVIFWENYCKNKCKNYINHFEDFENSKLTIGKKNTVKKYFFYGDMHYNKKGNKFLANKLTRVLLK